MTRPTDLPDLARHPSGAAGVRSTTWGLSRMCANALDTSFRWYDDLQWVLWIFVAVGSLAFVFPAFAQGTGPIPDLANRQLANPAQEAEATRLMQGLRCIQCQSQSIADSDAPMAASMRAEVRQQIADGKKSDDVRLWMIQRYGQWVSFEPEMRGSGLLLWLAPLLLLAIALLLSRGLFRKAGQ